MDLDINMGSNEMPICQTLEVFQSHHKNIYCYLYQGCPKCIKESCLDIMTNMRCFD